MKRRWKYFLVTALLGFATKADAQGPIFAGGGPVIEAGLGYSYTDMSIPSNTRFTMNGADANITVDFTRRFGVRLDAGYARAFNVFNTGRHADVLNYMGGPVFYPIRKRRFTLYTELLLGAARETGVNSATGGGTITGFANKFAWAAGGGVQYRIVRPLSLRAGPDYFHTSFFDPNIAVKGQNNLRAVISLVYTFGEGREH